MSRPTQTTRKFGPPIGPEAPKITSLKYPRVPFTASYFESSVNGVNRSICSSSFPILSTMPSLSCRQQSFLWKFALWPEGQRHDETILTAVRGGATCTERVICRSQSPSGPGLTCDSYARDQSASSRPASAKCNMVSNSLHNTVLWFLYRPSPSDRRGQVRAEYWAPGYNTTPAVADFREP